MKFLANENFPKASFKILTQAGFDIIHVNDEFPSVKDEEVMERAIEDGRIILTFDSDYGNLVFVKGMKAEGVIYLRLVDFLPKYPGELLKEILQSDEYIFEGNFTVIDENRIRQRTLPSQ